MDPSPRLIRVEIGADPPRRLDKALARDAPEQAALSRSRLARLIAEGAVSRAGTVLADPNAPVAAGDVVQIALPPPAEIATGPEAIPLAILHEDDDLIVVDKPAGMVVHPAPGATSGTLVNALLHHCGAGLSGIGGARRPGIVHRIDKDTSGLLVVAKSARAHHGLAAQFAAHTVDREYRAILHGCPDPADPRLAGLDGLRWEGMTLRIALPLGRHRTDRQRQAVIAGGRSAVTRLRVIERFGSPDAAALAACWLETGRTHQIRVHLAHVGHALIGDPVYGGRRRLSARALGREAAAAGDAFARQALHAARLGFVHPASREEMRFDSPLPADMAALLAALHGA